MELMCVYFGHKMVNEGLIILYKGIEILIFSKPLPLFETISNNQISPSTFCTFDS